MTSSQRVFAIGGGVVGGATALGLHNAGHDVSVIDVNPSRLAELSAMGLDARPELDLSGERSALVFITLPTPHVGRHYDFAIFRKGLASVGRALAHSTDRHVVVVRSTVTPGSTEGWIRETLEESSDLLAGEDFDLASNPEFLRAVSAADDFANPRVSVVAARSESVRGRLVALLKPFGGKLLTFENPATTELIKCAHNIFNATKISYWNEMWLVAQELGLDADEVAQTVALSAEASWNPSYGIRGGLPFGGACLPKDTAGFFGWTTDLDLDMPLLDATIRVNERMGYLEGGS